jgi:hypothetical protein
MPLFVSHDARERSRFFDETMTVTRQLLDDDAVAAELGARAVERFTHYMDLLYLPNISFGRAKTPVEYQTNDSLAFMPLYANEKLSLDPAITRLHQEAEEAVLNNLLPFTHPAQKTAFLSNPKVTNAAVSTYQPKRLAQTNRPTVIVPTLMKGDKAMTNRAVTTRPLIEFAIRDDYPLLLRGVIQLHELTHVQQMLHRPIITETSKKPFTVVQQEDELEAYHMSTRALRAAYHFSSNANFHGSKALNHPLAHYGKKLEALRLQENVDSHNPFHASQALLDKMKALAENPDL